MPVEVSANKSGAELASETSARRKAPVFVLGCGRSGTKLLYHMLLSSGNFAVYYSESNVFNLLGLRFGNLRRRSNRRKLLDVWLGSKLFERSGLTREEIEPRILEECENAGDFLRILMETIARKQGVERWAESTPLHTLYLPLIKKLIPDALVIHIIRDGRDVAVSLNRIGWIRPFKWDAKHKVTVAGIFWKWIVSKGRRYGRRMGGDYLEIHYEDLVNSPQQTLAKIGCFIDQDLNYERIRKVGLGSIENPNSSFRDDEKQYSPIGRWKALLSEAQVRELESVMPDLLTDTGYKLASVPRPRQSARLRFMSFLYPAYWDLKMWFKSHTPLAQTADIGRMGVGKR